MAEAYSHESEAIGLSRRALLHSMVGVAAAASFGGRAAAAAGPEQLIVDGLDTSVLNAAFIKLLAAGGVDCVHKSIGNLNSIAALYGFAHTNREDIVIVKSVRDILEAREDGKRSIIMGAQAAKQYEEALYSRRGTGSFADMVRAAPNFKGLGVGIQGLCYNTTNVFGSGCLNHEGPLTRAGQRLVQEINKNEMVLDIGGHCGERTSLDAIEISSGVPVVCTHTNFAALNPNARAISDRLAEAIAATGGVIGITAISAFHTHNAKTSYMKDRQATLGEHLDQYDHAKRLVGSEHVGLGPDFVWGWGETREHDPDDSAAFPPETMPVGLRTTVKDFENISKLPNLVAGLRERGWTEQELDAVLGGNWLRVYKQVWGT